jgi:hypothetical protein
LIPAGLKSKVWFEFPPSKIIIRINIYSERMTFEIMLTVKSIPVINTVEIQTNTDLPVPLDKISKPGIKRQVVVLLKTFIPDTGMQDITDINIGSHGSLLKLGETQQAVKTANKKEYKFLFHVGGFA